MNRCFIFGALPVDTLSIRPDDGDCIIAADKGYDTVLSLGLKPDVTVGDFDSLGTVPETENLIKLPVRKDDTDVGHAVEIGFEKGFTDFVVYGAVGGLLDHTFANVAIAHDIAIRGGRSLFIGDEFSFTVLHNAELILPPRKDGRISIFALGGTAYGVQLEGLSYGLKDYTLPCTSHIGVSNAFTGKSSRIAVERGDLLVVYQTEK